MVGVLIVTHAQMAEGIRSAASLIMGEQKQFVTHGLVEGADYDVFIQAVYDKIVALEEGDGVIVLVDLFGASPYNALARSAMRLVDEGVSFRVVTGVNLPMAIDALDMRKSMSLDELYKDVMRVAKEGVQEMWEILDR